MPKKRSPFWTPWPLPTRFKSRSIVERADFNRSASLHLACTQLNDTQSEKKRILNEWCDFLEQDPPLTTLRIATRCPQRLFDAACHCTRLTSLEVHWGPIDDLKPIKNLVSLQRLRIGSCSITDLKPIRSLKRLEHLSLGNLDRLSNYSDLGVLKQLKYLEIEGAPMMPKPVWIDNLMFLRKLSKLQGVALTAVKFRDNDLLRSFRKLNLKWLDLWLDDPDLSDRIIESLPKLSGGKILDSIK